MADTATPQTDAEPLNLWQQGRNSFYEMLGFSSAPMLDWTFSESQIASYAQVQTKRAVERADNPVGSSLDAQTWKDLALTAYRDRLANATSIFGQQGLHDRLANGCATDKSGLGDTVTLIKFLIDNPAKLQTLTAQLMPLRTADTEVCDVLFLRPPAATPSWISWSTLLPLSLALSVVAFVFTSHGIFAALWFIGSALAIIVAQQLMSNSLELWHREAKSVRMMLAVISRIATNSNNSDGAENSNLTNILQLGSHAGKLNRRITRMPMASAFPGVSDYLDWFLLTNVRHYALCQTVIKAERDFLQSCFAAIADLEAKVAVARHLSAADNIEKPRYCWASSQGTAAFAFSNLVHPLLAHATPISLSVGNKSMVLTGQNGIGKSTLMKSIGLSLVTHRAFGFCYAEAAQASNLPIFASLNNEDNLNAGESHYIAELRRARELLQASEASPGCVCLIDEIFRGTNHLEAVAAAGAVLNRLSQHATVIVSSHHAVLAPLLEASYAPYFLSMDDGDICSLQLLPGVLPDTNGIALLSKNGFDASIEADAKAVLNWISDYLAHPTKNPNIFSRD